MRTRALLFVLFVVSIGVMTSAQQPPAPPTPPGQPTQPPRTPARTPRPGEDPQKGTAVLRGYVTAADTGSPLRRAIVRAFSQDGRGSSVATTDAQGRFEIKELPAGRYTLNASKAGYVGMAYGQRRPEQQGTLLEILDSQVVEKIGFTLPRGGVVTGRILDEYGEAIAGAQVSALRFRYVNGARRLTPAGGGSTDDLGAFRIYGLSPGEYFVSAAVRSQAAMMMINGAPASGGDDGYAATYFPGTANPSEATRVTVKAAQEATNISFGLIAARTSRITGRAVSSSGEPLVQAFITAMPTDRYAMGPMGMMSGMTRPDGSFQIAGLAPGTYNVQLRPRGPQDANAEFANQRVTINNEDVDNVMLVARRGAIARGTIVTDDNTPLPIRPQQASVFARPAEPENMMMGGGNMQVHDDWSFEMTGLSDQRVLTANLTEAPDWSLKSVLWQGQEVIDTPIEFVPGQIIEGIQFVYSRKRTDLSGTIAGDRGAPATDATVIVFSESPDRWGYGTRFVRTARPSQDGRYSLKGMPPHDYLVVAVRDIEPGAWQDPELLESLRPQAVRVSLDEGETKVQDLKVARQ